MKCAYTSSISLICHFISAICCFLFPLYFASHCTLRSSPLGCTSPYYPQKSFSQGSSMTFLLFSYHRTFSPRSSGPEPGNCYAPVSSGKLPLLPLSTLCLFLSRRKFYSQGWFASNLFRRFTSISCCTGFTDSAYSKSQNGQLTTTVKLALYLAFNQHSKPRAGRGSHCIVHENIAKRSRDALCVQYLGTCILYI
jgi:hypothetical protein